MKWDEREREKESGKERSQEWMLKHSQHTYRITRKKEKDDDDFLAITKWDLWNGYWCKWERERDSHKKKKPKQKHTSMQKATNNNK